MANFKTKWKQFWCPHYFEDSVLISKTKRPDFFEDDEFVYTENKRQCQKCKADVWDNGVETKLGVTEWLRRGRDENA